ncbi:MAG: M28 family peptidase [Gemmatimonadetes bacterium]|nr:M28 family peptidase [Gemmatimonadota bacterium]
MAHPGVTADLARLRAHVEALEGVRHPVAAAEALRAAEDYLAQHLMAAGLEVARRRFAHAGRVHHNIVGIRWGRAPDRPRVLVGAHFDTVAGTPGADDNASGVAVMLEVARRMGTERFDATVEYVGFNLEEPQGYAYPNYRIGSRHFAAEARRERIRYAGALILEMVGYTNPDPGSQRVPWLLFWKRVPSSGSFLAATGDGRSARLLRAFARAARECAPGLEVVTFRSPFRGWPVWHTRLSDNASFWDRGYPALMLTDTAFLRNPYYHTSGDRAETLDFEFMAKVADAVAAAVQVLARSGDAAPQRPRSPA